MTRPYPQAFRAISASPKATNPCAVTGLMRERNRYFQLRLSIRKHEGIRTVEKAAMAFRTLENPSTSHHNENYEAPKMLARMFGIIGDRKLPRLYGMRRRCTGRDDKRSCGRSGVWSVARKLRERRARRLQEGHGSGTEYWTCYGT
jgi:hypothetical protein